MGLIGANAVAVAALEMETLGMVCLKMKPQDARVRGGKETEVN